MVEETMGVQRLLDHLEKQCGGHGNGLMLVKDKEIIYINKGILFNNKKITKKLLSYDFDYAMYHTRVASVSKPSDANCHPFWTKKKDLALMMNGTEREIGYLAEPLGITDTEMVFRMVRDYNVPLDALEDMTAKYMGFKDGKVFLVNTFSAGLEYIEKSDAFVVASSFPVHIKSKTLEAGLWKEGQAFKEKTYTRYSKWNDDYMYGTSYRGGVFKGTKSEKHKEIEELRKLAYTDEEVEYLREMDFLLEEEEITVPAVINLSNAGYDKDKSKGRIK